MFYVLRMPIYLFLGVLCALFGWCVYTYTVQYCCLINESSNYKLGRLDNKFCTYTQRVYHFWTFRLFWYSRCAENAVGLLVHHPLHVLILCDGVHVLHVSLQVVQAAVGPLAMLTSQLFPQSYRWG